MAVTGNWEPWSAVDKWPPGWYADPWQAGRERRWTGSTWTSETRGAEGPSIAALGGGTGPPAPAAPPPQDGAPPEPEPETPWWKRPRYLALVAALTATALILGFTVTYVAADTSTSKNATTQPTFPLPTQPPGTVPTPTNPTPSQPSPGASTPPSIGGTPGAGNPGSQQSPSAQPTDPNANLLQQLVVREADVTGQPVTLTTGGDTTQDPTLDLCNGTYPSEALRTARLQVDEYDANGDPAFSTEAVLYRNAAATAQAFAELRSVTARCPDSPVTSPVGEPTTTTTFSPPPDTAWPHTPGVIRQAYDLITTDDSGTSTHSYAVYLRRGRALLGLYFSAPTQQLNVAGKTDMPAIVNLFEQRLASLPAQAIGA